MHTLHCPASTRGVFFSAVLAIELTFGVASPARAFDQAKPNTLGREEISEGWVLLFDGESTFGWQERRGAEAAVVDGALQVVSGERGWLGTTTEFADFVLRMEYRVDEPGAACEVVLRCAAPGDPRRAGTPLKFESVDASETWNRVEIRAEGPHLNVAANGKPAARTEIPSSDYARRPRGLIGLAGNGTVTFRNVALRPLGTEPIFNGRDLTGWSVVPGHQSVYRVTPEGWLNVTDGNGQIETESVWDDLVLQLDVISNGDHLNSGVFFRGDRGAFWSGYESQVRNEWITEVTLKDGTTLEGSYTEKGDRAELRRCEDDGKRLRPTDDVRELSKNDIAKTTEHRASPVDFGTGGVYNLQPARTVVPSDRRWYTKTIVAAGNHIAVWVDGYPVSDFTDTRPRGRNARTNQRLEAGPISLQGHDPTTDLSFRNLRLAPLPKRP
jgi:hypothetical protein